MIVNKRYISLMGLALAFGMAHAEQGLNSSSQSKVNNAKAKMWSRSSGAGDGYNNQVDQKRVVNFGSRRGNGCNLNVGTVQPGQKAPKEIVVTTKEVINVCK